MSMLWVQTEFQVSFGIIKLAVALRGVALQRDEYFESRLQRDNAVIQMLDVKR